MSYTGKYALAKHETLALKCEDLERQLAEARERIGVLSQKLKLSKATASSAIKEIERLKEKGE